MCSSELDFYLFPATGDVRLSAEKSRELTKNPAEAVRTRKGSTDLGSERRALGGGWDSLGLNATG